VKAMPLRDLVTAWLDPEFVREEELATILDRKSPNDPKPQRNYKEGLIVGNGWVEIIVPASYEWFVYSVRIIEPVDVGVGTVPKEHFCQLNDDLNIDFMDLGTQQLPQTHAQSYITWGIDLTNMLEDDGVAAGPGYKITAPFPKMWLKEGYYIYLQRDGVGGVPTTTARYRILYLERKVS